MYDHILVDYNFFLFRFYIQIQNMDMVTVSPVFAVGMQHWGPLALQNNQPHIVLEEPTNPKDLNALAVYDGQMTKRGYICRRQAGGLCQMIRASQITGSIYLIPKESETSIRYVREGPSQEALLIFRVKTENKEEVKANILYHGFNKCY